MVELLLPKQRTWVRFPSPAPENLLMQWAEAARRDEVLKRNLANTPGGQALAALQGRTDAAREIANRVEGKVVENVEVAGAVTFISHIPHAERKKK